QDPAENKVKLYINGALAASVPRNGSGVSTTSPLLLGDRTGGGQSYNGRMDEVAIYRRALSSNEIKLHYLTGTNSPARFAGSIQTNVRAPMLDVNATLYLRAPFVVTNLSSLMSLTLSIQYDDGFVAWINGVEIVRRNAPTVPTWDATATVKRDPFDAETAEPIDLSALFT